MIEEELLNDKAFYSTVFMKFSCFQCPSTIVLKNNICINELSHLLEAMQCPDEREIRLVCANEYIN